MFQLGIQANRSRGRVWVQFVPFLGFQFQVGSFCTHKRVRTIKAGRPNPFGNYCLDFRRPFWKILRIFFNKKLSEKGDKLWKETCEKAKQCMTAKQIGIVMFYFYVFVLFVRTMLCCFGSAWNTSVKTSLKILKAWLEVLNWPWHFYNFRHRFK